MSHRNRVTPAVFAGVLVQMDRSPHQKEFMGSLAEAGERDATLKRRMHDLSGKVFAKTGTLGAGDLFNNRLRLPTKALGGYIDTKNGRHFAFAIVASNSVFDDISGVFAANDDVGQVVAIIQQTH